MPHYLVRLCQPALTQFLTGAAEAYADLPTALAAAQRTGWSMVRKRRHGAPQPWRSSLEVTDDRGTAVARIMLAEVAREIR